MKIFQNRKLKWWNNIFNFSLVGVQKRISQGLEVLQYYTTKNWTFKNDKFLRMKENMSDIDRQKFYFSVEEVRNTIIFLDFDVDEVFWNFFVWLQSQQINWTEYIGNYISGARLYLLKEKPESLPKARILLRRLYILDKLISILFHALILWLVYSYWNNIIYSFESVLDYSTSLINRRLMKKMD